MIIDSVICDSSSKNDTHLPICDVRNSELFFHKWKHLSNDERHLSWSSGVHIYRTYTSKKCIGILKKLLIHIKLLKKDQRFSQKMTWNSVIRDCRQNSSFNVCKRALSNILRKMIDFLYIAHIILNVLDGKNSWKKPIEFRICMFSVWLVIIDYFYQYSLT